MAIKRATTVEATPETAKKTKRTKVTNKVEVAEQEEEEEETPLTGIFCLKQRQDMKIFEEKEDCFILDFDPDDSFDSQKLPSSETPESDDDVVIIHEKGEVACRDFPHSRHLCSKYPFGSTDHALHCDNCCCYVCDIAAPCPYWTPGHGPHCDAMENARWNRLREVCRNMKNSK